MLVCSHGLLIELGSGSLETIKIGAGPGGAYPNDGCRFQEAFTRSWTVDDLEAIWIIFRSKPEKKYSRIVSTFLVGLNDLLVLSH